MNGWLLVLWCMSILLAIPVLTWVCQLLLGSLAPVHLSAQADQVHGPRGRVAVVIPAHNEQTGIVNTIQSVKLQLRDGDRLLVVADNCQDRTAEVARELGAEVSERTHQTLRGKGYALDHGVAQLRQNPPDAVLMIDADCRLHPASLDVLARRCLQLQRPVQGGDLMQAPEGAPIKTKLAELAWLVKNRVRPLGGAWMGWPCQLMGTGMMFPWRVIESAPLASGHLAEDMQLGASLAKRGLWPVYCDAALVTSRFPVDNAALLSQRTRWEHGHLSTIFSQGPALLAEAVRQRSWKLLGMALDMSVPPMTSLALAVSALCALSLAAGVVFGAWWVFVANLAQWLLLALALAVAWQRHGKAVMTANEFLSIPLYVLAKVPIYAGYLSRRQTGWVRTGRDDESP